MIQRQSAPVATVSKFKNNTKRADLQLEETKDLESMPISAVNRKGVKPILDQSPILVDDELEYATHFRSNSNEVAI